MDLILTFLLGLTIGVLLWTSAVMTIGLLTVVAQSRQQPQLVPAPTPAPNPAPQQPVVVLSEAPRCCPPKEASWPRAERTATYAPAAEPIMIEHDGHRPRINTRA